MYVLTHIHRDRDRDRHSQHKLLVIRDTLQRAHPILLNTIFVPPPKKEFPRKKNIPKDKTTFPGKQEKENKRKNSMESVQHTICHFCV